MNKALKKDKGQIITPTGKVLKRNKFIWTKETTFALIVVLIPLFGYFFFNGFPFVLSFVLTVCDIEGYDLSTITWNNFENFRIVFSDTRFYKALWQTLWMASSELISLVVALTISVLLTRKVKGQGVFQILYFVPYICSGVAVAIMWNWILDGDHGLLNALLGTNISWLNNSENPATLTWAIMVANIWQAPGYGIVMFKAALDAINPALYEASEIDGAGPWIQFWSITIPSVAPTTFYLLFASVLTGLTMFDRATLMAPVSWTQTAGYNDMGLTLMYYVYILGTQRMEMELASVVSVVLFIVTLTLSVFIMKKRNEKVEG